MQRKIIDMHHHLGAVTEIDALAATYDRLGVVKAVLLGMPSRRQPDSNDVAIAAHRKYPELFVPFVGFDLDAMPPDRLERFRDEGFVGIKFIGPAKAYNDPSYFGVYAKAAELNMPALFHLGIVANKGPWTDCDSNLMRPIHLDHIARRLPDWRFVGAHLGNPWYEEATMSCRWNPNLFFDLSGSTLKKKTPQFLASLLWWTGKTAYKSPDGSSAWQKIVFGSDVATGEIEDVVNDYEKLMAALDMPAALREHVWYGAAAKVLGLDA